MTDNSEYDPSQDECTLEDDCECRQCAEDRQAAADREFDEREALGYNRRM